MGSWRNVYLRAVVASLLAAVIAFAIAKLNIAGSEASSDRSSDAIAQRVFAPFYGADRKGQKRISVVYLDDVEADTLKATLGWDAWPPSFSDFGLMIDNLAGGEKKPRALFVDFVLSGDAVPADDAAVCADPTKRAAERRCGYWRFLDALQSVTRYDDWKARKGCQADPQIKIACITAAGGIPVFLARSDAAELPRWNARQREMAGPAVFVNALVGVYEYPLVQAYPSLARPGDVGVRTYDLTPAAALYAAECIAEPDTCDEPAWARARAAGQRLVYGEQTPAPAWPAAFREPLALWWGGRLADGQAEVTEAMTGHPPTCRTAARGGWPTAMGDTLRRSLGEALPLFRSDQPECLHTFHMSYASLVSGHSQTEAAAARLLDDKLLLLGAQYRASNDWVESPVNKQVPGVFLHAMALDNLIEAGRGYRRNTQGLGERGDIVETALVFVLALVGSAGAIWRKRRGDLPFGRVIGIYAVITLISLALLLTASVLSLTFLHMSPINWIGVGTVALTYALFAMRGALLSDVGGWLARWPVTAWMPKALTSAAAWLDVGRPDPPKARRTRARSTAKRRPKAKSKPVTIEEVQS